MQRVGSGDAAASLPPPQLLPEAPDLLAVGKALVQVLNVLGSGLEARLAVTRALRRMSAPDREWLVNLAYPQLQDSYRRRALPELRMLVCELVGADCC